MLLPVLVAVMGLGGLASLMATPRHTLPRLVAGFAPALALLVVLLPLPLPSALTLPWSPALLFPEPLSFEAGPIPKTFAADLLLLLLAIEWTGLGRRHTRRTVRASVFFLAAAGLAAFFAANGLALVLSWAWIDLISFALLVLLHPIRAEGAETTLPSVQAGGAVSSFAFNLLSTLLVLLAFLPELSSRGMGLEALRTTGLNSVAVAAFLAAIVLRLGVLPWQMTLAPAGSQAGGLEVLVRLLSPSVGLATLARVWPEQLNLPPIQPILAWITVLATLAIFLGSVGWWVSSDSRNGRSLLMLGVLSLTGIAAANGQASPQVFEAAGGLLLLGGGVILLYRGQGTWQRWSAFWPVCLALIFAGAPLTAGAVLGQATFAALRTHGFSIVMIVTAIGEMFLIASTLRVAFLAGEDLPPGERTVWLAHYAGLTILVAGLVGGSLWGALAILRNAPAPALLLFATETMGGALMARAGRRLRDLGEEAFAAIERILQLDWLWRALASGARALLRAVRLVDQLLSGEGALLWALGISILIWILLRAG
ncbi:MAG: hypothetical protein ABSF61_09635 [Anaerolineales bacterium]